MRNYTYTEKCREISGFGGDYETACREMVIAGMEWLDQNKDAKPSFKQSPQVFGLTIGENADMNAMQDAMNKVINYGASGAMMQAATNHVLWARAHGWDKYIEEMCKEGEG